MGLGLASAILMLGLLAGGIVAYLSGQTLTAPDWVTARLEGSLNQEIAPARVGISGIEITFRERAAPLISLAGVRVFDGEDRFLAWVPRAGLSLDRSAMMGGRVSPQSVSVEGLRLSLGRDDAGNLELDLGAGQDTATLGGTPADILDGLNKIFAAPGLEALREISATDVRIQVADRLAGRIWDIGDGRLDLTRTADGANLRVSFAAEGYGGAEARVAVSVAAAEADRSAQIGLRIDDVSTADIASWGPSLAWLQVLDAPASGSLRLRLDRSGTLAQVNAALDIGEGAIEAPGAPETIGLSSGRAYFSFDPGTASLRFDQISVVTTAATVSGDGQMLLQTGARGQELIAQLQISRAKVTGATIGLTDAVSFDSGSADLRLMFNPFRLDLGQLTLTGGDTRVRAQGRAEVAEAALSAALDVTLDRIATDRFLELWPASMVPDTREWLGENLTGGIIRDAHAVLRTRGQSEPVVALGFTFDDLTLRYLPEQPPLTGLDGYGALEGGRMTIVADRARVATGPMGEVDASGTVFTVADVSAQPGIATIDIRASGPLGAQLALLDKPPFRFLSRAGQPVDVASGTATTNARIRLPLLEIVPDEQIEYQVTAIAENVVSDRLVPGQRITSDRAQITAARLDGLRISGRAEMRGIPFEGDWHMPLDAGSDGSSRLAGAVAVSQAAADALSLGLPAGTVDGSGLGRLEIAFPAEGAPRMRFFTDLNRIGLRIPQLGWSKARDRTGELEVLAELGEPVRIEWVSLSAPGLEAKGTVRLAEEGGLERAELSGVRVGNWFSGPVDLVGRGAQAPFDIAVRGGRLDIRRSTFQGSSGGSGGSGGALDIALDRLVISDGIALTGLRGRFPPGAALKGGFSGRVNGKTRVTGTLRPSRHGTAVSIRSQDGGGVLRDAGIYANGIGGELEMTLVPREREGFYDGTLNIRNPRVRDAPALAELLAAVSVVGLLEQLGGQGLAFQTVSADFVLTPDAVFIEKSSALGASLGLTMDGRYDLGTGAMDMQGVVTPLYIVNAIGQIVAREGEGLIGISYRMKGTTADPKVSVNPLSLLTPGFLREIFRRPTPKAGE